MYNDTIDAMLLILQALLWGCGIYIIWSKNRLFAIFCMVLYLYLLPTEITYRFFHHFSEEYWGVDVWYETYWFINFSLFTLYLFFNLKKGNNKVYNVVYRKKYNDKWMGWIIVICYSIITTYYLVSNITLITYANLVENGSDAFTLDSITITDILVRSLPAFVIIPLLAVNNKRILARAFLLYNIILYFLYAFISGNRSDMLSFFMAILLLWLYGRNLRMKQILSLGTFALLFLYVAGKMSDLRGMEGGSSLAETLLKQDYLSPAYNLIGVQAKHIIDPIAVISSQIHKIFPAMGGEWLYIKVAPDVFGVEFTASKSAAFHPFTEGYLFAGFLGFLYNGIVIGLCLTLWNRFMSTNDKRFNRFMFALMGCIFFSIVRAQSVNFIRNIFFDFLPASFIYARLYGINIHYLRFFMTGKSKRIDLVHNSDNITTAYVKD